MSASNRKIFLIRKERKNAKKEGNLFINARKRQIDMAALDPVKIRPRKERHIISEYIKGLNKSSRGRDKRFELRLKSRVVIRTTK